MKKLLIIAAAIAIVSLSSFGQGCFYMEWLPLDHGITIGSEGIPGPVGAYVGSEYSAEAYMGPVGAPAGSLSPVAASLTAFDLSGSTALGKLPSDGAGQFLHWDSISTALPLGNAAIQIRVWFNGGMYPTYESALAAGVNTGRSTVMTINLRIYYDPTIQTLTNIGMLPFSVNAIPEPSPIALAGLGAATLLLFRRRK